MQCDHLIGVSDAGLWGTGNRSCVGGKFYPHGPKYGGKPSVQGIDKNSKYITAAVE